MTESINPLLLDLALILIVAGAVTLIFKALKQPVVLGYVVAGLLTGPYITFLPTAREIANVEFWGNIGVIFLLFSLGLEFSFKKIKKVGGPGAISVFAEAIMMFSMGFLVGQVFGWDNITSLFLGAMLSISSTSIVVKTFADLGIGNRKSAQLSIGTLIFEDLVAILLMVLLPTFVISKTFNGTELLSKLLSITVFLLLWFTGGVYLIPTIFRKLKKYLTDEMLIIISLGLCFTMVVVTVRASISEALGAFVMGSILSGTIQRDKILQLTKPIKDFFGAIFFVSVGMLVDPSVLLHYWPHILLISVTVLLAKPLALIAGYLFSRQTLKLAIPGGITLCQIGEFSYIMAQMGRELEATPDYLFPVIVAVSIVTTFATPYWVKAGDKLYDFIYSRSGESWRNVIDRLGSGKQILNKESDWKQLIRRYTVRVFILTIWIAAVGAIFTGIVNPLIAKLLGTALWVRLIMFAITIIAMAPFLWALVKKRDKELYNRIWEDRKFSRGPLLFMNALKYIIAVISISYIASKYITASIGFIMIVSAAIIVVVVLSKQLKKYYSKIESNFLANLDSEGGRRFIVPLDKANEIHMEKCVVGQNSYLAGRTIGQIHRKKDTGALVIQLIRGSKIINLPHKDTVIYPSDSLLILGSDGQLKAFMGLSYNKQGDFAVPEDETIAMELFQITLENKSPLVGHNANITSIRDKFGVLIIGVEKANDNIFLRPNSSVTMESGDTVWLVGNKKRINAIIQENLCTPIQK